MTETTRTGRAIGGCTAAALAAGMALAAYAQVMTAPPVKAPVQAPVLRPTAVVTVPYVVAISYPAPGQNPPTTAVSFAPSTWSTMPAATSATRAGQPGTTGYYIDMLVNVGGGSPAPVIPPKTPLTSMTLTAYKAGVAVETITYTQAMLISSSLSSPSPAGTPQESLRFYFTQATTTRTQ